MHHKSPGCHSGTAGSGEVQGSSWLYCAFLIILLPRGTKLDAHYIPQPEGGLFLSAA